MTHNRTVVKPTVAVWVCNRILHYDLFSVCDVNWCTIMGIIVHYAKSTVIVFPVGLQFTRPSNTVLFVFGSFEGEAISIEQVFAIACYVHHLGLLDIVWNDVHVAATTMSWISTVAPLGHAGSPSASCILRQFDSSLRGKPFSVRMC